LPGLLAWAVRIIGQLSRPRKPEPDPYRAFEIGPDGFAVAVHIIAADYDDMALEKAMQLQGQHRIELWCGSRKVGGVPPTT
jgi:hypothetical protein